MSQIRTTDLYLIHTLTNLHAGKGDSNYGIVDKEVQRDAVTNLPTIHASSIKGAMREQFAYYEGRGEKGDIKKSNKAPKITSIFGSAAGDKDNFSVGTHNFYQAQLLALPAQSNAVPYFLATSPKVIQDFCNWSGLVGATYKTEFLNVVKNAKPEKKQPVLFRPENKAISLATGESLFVGELEVNNWTKENMSADLRSFIGYDYLCVLTDQVFKDLCSRLPVIARNYLDSGISKNLWYEEVVPSRSLFYWAVERPTSNGDFLQLLKQHTNKRVQIGGNASVGYGLCQIRNL